MKDLDNIWIPRSRYAPASEATTLQAGDWQTHAVQLGPSSTTSSATRITWWFAPNGEPNDAVVTLGAASLMEVLPVDPGRVQAEYLRATRAMIANVSAASVRFSVHF